MKKFVLHYSSDPEAMKAMATATPEEKAAAMQPWLAWRDKMGDRLVDFGTPLMPVAGINADGSDSANVSEVSGYSIIKANDLQEAKELLADHPHLQYESGRPIQVFEGMDVS